MPAKEIIAEIRSLQRIKKSFTPGDSAISVLDNMIKEAKRRLDEWDVFSYHNRLCYWCGRELEEGCNICLYCK